MYLHSDPYGASFSPQTLFLYSLCNQLFGFWVKALLDTVFGVQFTLWL